MCGRYCIDPEDPALRELYARLEAALPGPILKRGEIFPTDTVPVLISGGRALAMRWGFAHNGKTVINARSETLTDVPLFNALLRDGRCLIPATNYFEWEVLGAKKQKYAVSAPTPFYLAGLYRQEQEGALPVFVVLTRPAAPSLAFLHERMPVILPPGAAQAWLEGDFGALRAAEAEYRYQQV